MNSNTELGKDSIYILIDPTTQQVRYVGKTKYPKVRFKEHLWPCSLKFKTHKNYWLESLLKQNLKPEMVIIDKVNEKESEFWEQFFIDLFKGWGFNLTNSVKAKKGICALSKELQKEISLRQSINRKGKCTGDKNPAKRKEVKEKISKFHKGKIVSKETRELMSRNNKGTKRNFSEEHRKFLSEEATKRNLSKKGKPLSEEIRKKRKEKALRGENHPMYGKHHTVEARKKMSLAKKGKVSWGKVVKQCDPKTKICIRTFPSAKEAAIFYEKKNGDYIAKACRNQKVKLGFLWEYESN